MSEHLGLLDPDGRWRLRCAGSTRRAAVTVRAAALTGDDAAAALRAAAAADWTGVAAEGFRGCARSVLSALALAGGRAEDTAGDLEALATALERLP